MALSLTRQKAVIEAQSAPPIAPSTSIDGQIHWPVASGNQIGMAEAKIAPRMNWPSAPMLNTLARKPIASPCAIRSSGPAFSSTSENDAQERKGSRSIA